MERYRPAHGNTWSVNAFENQVWMYLRGTFFQNKLRSSDSAENSKPWVYFETNASIRNSSAESSKCIFFFFMLSSFPEAAIEPKVMRR